MPEWGPAHWSKGDIPSLLERINRQDELRNFISSQQSYGPALANLTSLTLEDTFKGMQADSRLYPPYRYKDGDYDEGRYTSPSDGVIETLWHIAPLLRKFEK